VRLAGALLPCADSAPLSAKLLENGTLMVEVSVEGYEAVVAVTDQGVGISPEELGRIFQPFRRSERTRALVPGIGLGLSV